MCEQSLCILLQPCAWGPRTRLDAGRRANVSPSIGFLIFRTCAARRRAAVLLFSSRRAAPRFFRPSDESLAVTTQLSRPTPRLQMRTPRACPVPLTHPTCDYCEAPSADGLSDLFAPPRPSLAPTAVIAS